jgi:sugar (pentulose or hexulose) kinase
LVDTRGSIMGSSFIEYNTYYPRYGWSEQNPEDWDQTLLVTMAKLMRETGLENESDVMASDEVSFITGVNIDVNSGRFTQM